MGKIHRLSQATIEQIAAGEVIERPASIVKELIENSLDAGADHIVVHVEEGGKSLLSVSDNGCGMESEDALLCVERHATSKLKQSDDLWTLSSFGFRGEALAAVAAVADFTIETKLNSPDAIVGTKVQLQQGRVVEHGSFGCPSGTRMLVKNLFAQVPARLKFLKSDAVEYGHVADVLTQAALSSPHVHFELWRDGKRSELFPKVTELADRVVSVVGEEWRERLLSVDESHELIRVSGVVGDFSTNFSTNRQLHVFVNRRPLKDRLLMSAVSLAYGEMLPRGRFPLAAVFIDLAPQDVDVNVHPTKREVRFASAQAVHDFVRRSLKKKLQAAAESSFYIPVVPQASKEEGNGLSFPQSLSGNLASALFVERRSAFPTESSREQKCLFPTTNDSPVTPRIRALAQLHRSYILAEGESGELVVVDQHAAHERIGYNQLLAQHEGGKVAQQQLLLPELLQLSAHSAALLEEQLSAFAELGFVIASFGENTYRVTAVPALLGTQSVKDLLEQMLSDIVQHGQLLSHDELLRKLFATIACHQQIRFGDRLMPLEMQALLQQIDDEKITHCPHGRPIQFSITLAELEKRFQRT